MSHGEYTREDSRKDLSASLTGLVVGLIWIALVGGIAYSLAPQPEHEAGAATAGAAQHAP
jgi:hypothetical protein